MCNIDKIARDLNSSPIWADANLVARLVISVAGSRDNWMDLITLMMMLHKSRGYSPVTDALSSNEEVMRDSTIVDHQRDHD
jgi:hypothetical protein